ncbi:MAG: stage II sporulation protein M [Lachnospiraceae bacterium]|nr:stage II sporulation protein M [Lachnospiraceae bacterium]
MELWREKERAEKKKKLLTFFLVGFGLGVFYIIFLGHSENSNMLMSSYFFSKYQYMEYSPLDLLGYILKLRIPTLAFLWLMGLTVAGSIMVLGFSLWTGFSLGLIWTMAVTKLGMAGLLLCLMSMIPQYFVYFPTFTYGLLRIYEMAQNKKMTQNKKVLGVYVGAFLVTAGLVLVGAILESYVNPWLLKTLIKKM